MESIRTLLDDLARPGLLWQLLALGAMAVAGLLALELGGWIERLPGGRFQRVR